MSGTPSQAIHRALWHRAAERIAGPTGASDSGRFTDYPTGPGAGNAVVVPGQGATRGIIGGTEARVQHLGLARGPGEGGVVDKLDLKKQLKHLYLPSAREVVVVDVPEMQFLLVDGRLEADATPGTSPGFTQAIGALYSLSYTLKFMSKRRVVEPVDYTVMALEGLWDVPMNASEYTNSGDWTWTLMMMQPDHITSAMFFEALGEVRQKHEKGDRPTEALDRVRFERFREGLCLQVMHVGSYAEEPRTIAQLEAYAREHAYVFHGRHHEIYLGDPRTAKPENLKTVLRHAVARAA